MSSFHWPQYVVLALIAFGVCSQCVKYGKTEKTTGWIVAGVTISLIIEGLFAFVLHEGGFW